MALVTDRQIIGIAYEEAVIGITDEMLVSRDDNWYEYILSLPRPLQAAYMIGVMNMQVINGGFHQYFVNGYGQFAQETINYLELIGATSSAQLLRSALELVNEQCLPEPLFRRELRNFRLNKLFKEDTLNKPLDVLDSEYYNLETIEDLEALLGSYLRNQSHKS